MRIHLLFLFLSLLATTLAFDKRKPNLYEGPPKEAFTQGLSTKPGSFDRIFIMQFENQPYFFVEYNTDFSNMAKRGVSLTNYYAVTHPSQPNYFSQVAGEYFNWNSDDDKDLNTTFLVDLLEAKGISWKAYQESLPAPCYSSTLGSYYRKHNPFISFASVRLNPQRCAKIVNASQLDDDLASGNLPQYSYYTPNINNDGHDSGLVFAGHYLTAFLEPRLPKFPPGTIIVITWDEDDYLDSNHIYTAVIGSMIKPGTTDNTAYTHYSLLRTVEDNFQLGSLNKNDAKANGYQFFTN